MIIKATIEDVSALNKLVNTAYRGDSSRQGWTTEADLLDGTRTDENSISEIFQTPSSIILKYVEDGKILGCVHLDKRDNGLYLGMLTVEPTFQANGLGKKILFAAEEEARKQGCKTIHMTVISVRTELIAWYQRRGYSATGERRPMIIKTPSMEKPKKHLEFIVLEKAVI
jgi:N-acetylglutamate synthase-like GNAT family acetyltransferase